MKTNLFFPLVFSIFPTESFADPLDIFQDCDDCPVMIELPLGEFVMGAPEDEFRRRVIWRDGALRPLEPGESYDPKDEGPQGRVLVDIRFAMGRDEITYDHWMTCVRDGGCNGYVPPIEMFKQSESGEKQYIGSAHPVLHVNLEDAKAYVDWLNKLTGTDAYRLPTEAEWEYAARASTTTRFAQGENLSSHQANFSGKATEVNLIEDRPDLLTREGPVMVDELDAANDWGLRHMSGNASEITTSCYSRDFVAYPTTSQWLAIAQEDACEFLTTRGGAYAFSMDTLRVASRTRTRSHFRTKFGGFRIVKEIR